MPASYDRLSTTLGARYRLERELGAGGMATVYLAADLKHDRKVAIKVLKPELAAVLGAERFVQEIRTTAALSHPHILPLLDSGETGGFLYYVMPYIEGEALREKLDRETQLGIDDAVRITCEVADALDYAHRHGVIHRDIKPENILLHDGRAIVMDFGIALAVSAAAGGRMTETGLSLGTPHYMSPEQATAEKTITARSDVYSLASVLYEALSGEPPHTGGSAQQIIMKIIAEPVQDVTALRKSVPPNVAAALGRALEKLPADRFETAKAFAEALANPVLTTAASVAHAADASSVQVLGSRLSWRAVAGVLGALSVAAVAIAAWGWLRPSAPSPVVRYPTSLAVGDTRNGLEFLLTVAISPDGGSVVFSDPPGNAGQLFVKRREDLVPRVLEGTSGGTGPFFSPDGKWIGYFAHRELRRIPSGGGASLKLADSVGVMVVPPVSTASLNSGAWLEDGSIIYASNPDLWRLPANGGAPQRVVSAADLGAAAAFLPTPLPASRGVLFVACTVGCQSRRVDVYDARRDTVRVLFEDAMGAWYAPTGHVLYLTGAGTLLAVPWDDDALAPAGTAVAVLDGIQAPGFAMSPEGTALHVLGPPLFVSGPPAGGELVQVDRTGRVDPVDPSWRFNPGGETGMTLSPDGNRMAIHVLSRLGDDIWIKQLPSGTLSRLTFYDGLDRSPWWTADGQSILFVSDRPTPPDTTSGKYAVWKRSADGTGQPELLWAGDSVRYAVASADGQWLVLRSGPTDLRLFAVRPATDSVARPLLAGRFRNYSPALSPNSHWLAYVSEKNGRPDVFIRPFPNVDERETQVSSRGGWAPVWANNGHELFYMDSGSMNVVSIQPGPPFTVGQPRILFERPERIRWGGLEGLYAVTPDDQRFLMLRSVPVADTGAGAAPTLVMVQNFLQELREKLKR